uniref:Dolichyl-phosphate-mannose--protein mannosyltransferase n=1 Tax=Blastobotrys adeninivorans TaxID=409370 RepID=A0A060SWY2_BLAAD
MRNKDCWESVYSINSHAMTIGKERELSLPLRHEEHERESLSANTGTGFWIGQWRPGVPFTADTPCDLKVKLKMQDGIIIVFLLALGGIVHNYRIDHPAVAVREEATICHHLQQYSQGKFFVDTSPPFPTLLYYSVWKILGLRDCNSDYVKLRIFAAGLSTLTVACTYVIQLLSNCTRGVAVVTSMMVVFENSLVTENRFISSSSVLHFSIALMVVFWKVFERQKPFSLKWILSVILLSGSVGCVTASAKHLGSIMFAGVVCLHVYQVWWRIPDLKASWIKECLELTIRIVTLVVVSVAMFASACIIHLNLTPQSGDTDWLMPGPFQAQLIGSDKLPMPAEIISGSFITARHYGTGGYLHSHEISFPRGSFQQQVTLYSFHDLNNVWTIDLVDRRNESNPILKDGDYVTLRHVLTNKHLHSHDHFAPVSQCDWQFEVSAYGADSYEGDMNDVWKVELVSSYSDSYGDGKLKTIKSAFRLKHILMNCYLFSHRKQLPPWGGGQQEVTCAREVTLKNSVWYIETNVHPYHAGMNNSERFVSYRECSLGEMFLDYTDAISWMSQQAAEEGFKSPAQTEVYRLPLMVNGSLYYAINAHVVYLVGNPAVGIVCMIAIVSWSLFKIATILRLQRGKRVNWKGVAIFDHNSGRFMIAWILLFSHIILSNELIIENYLTCHYFAILLSGTVLNFGLQNAPRLIPSVFIYITWVLYSFASVRNLTYGLPWTLSGCQATHAKGFMALNGPICSYYEYGIIKPEAGQEFLSPWVPEPRPANPQQEANEIVELWNSQDMYKTANTKNMLLKLLEDRNISIQEYLAKIEERVNDEDEGISERLLLSSAHSLQMDVVTPAPTPSLNSSSKISQNTAL